MVAAVEIGRLKRLQSLQPDSPRKYSPSPWNTQCSVYARLRGLTRWLRRPTFSTALLLFALIYLGEQTLPMRAAKHGVSRDLKVGSLLYLQVYGPCRCAERA